MDVRFARLISVALCFIVGQAAFAQRPPLTPAQQQEMQTYSLYSEFFDRVGIVERMADRSEATLAAQGRSDNRHLMRRTIQDDVGLPDPAWKAVVAAAKDYDTKMDAMKSRRKAALDAYKAEHPNATSYSPELMHDVVTSSKQRLQWQIDNVNQIKAALSPAEFQQLDTWVRTSMHKGMSTKGGTQ